MHSVGGIALCHGDCGKSYGGEDGHTWRFWNAARVAIWFYGVWNTTLASDAHCIGGGADDGLRYNVSAEGDAYFRRQRVGIYGYAIFRCCGCDISAGSSVRCGNTYSDFCCATEYSADDTRHCRVGAAYSGSKLCELVLGRRDYGDSSRHVAADYRTLQHTAIATADSNHDDCCCGGDFDTYWSDNEHKLQIYAACVGQKMYRNGGAADNGIYCGIFHARVQYNNTSCGICTRLCDACFYFGEAQ